jgi:5-methyltetrahydropteroyltriglutamate--homocysteine methyltransferase
MFKDSSDADYVKLVQLHVAVLNDALRDLPAERMRLHICWGNYEGPHSHDIGLREILPIVLKARPQALLFEAANPRHAHEWTDIEAVGVPDDKILVPGVIDSTTHFVEHPRLVAQRLRTFERIVGRERLLAGTDCGFSTFAGFSGLDADVVYAKLATLVEGARLASVGPS